MCRPEQAHASRSSSLRWRSRQQRQQSRPANGADGWQLQHMGCWELCMWALSYLVVMHWCSIKRGCLSAGMCAACVLPRLPCCFVTYCCCLLWALTQNCIMCPISAAHARVLTGDISHSAPHDCCGLEQPGSGLNARPGACQQGDVQRCGRHQLWAWQPRWRHLLLHVCLL